MKNILLYVLLMNPEMLLLISHYIYLQPNQDPFHFIEAKKIVQSKHNIGFLALKCPVIKYIFLQENLKERQCNLSGIFLVKLAEVKRVFTCDRKATTFTGMFYNRSLVRFTVLYFSAGMKL